MALQHHSRLAISLVSAAAAVALIGAPAAAASPSCSTVERNSSCSYPGNSELNVAPHNGANGYGDGFYGGPYPVPFWS